MKYAENIADRKEVFAALAACQGAIESAVKDASGQVGNQKYKYADLAAVFVASQKALRDNGLALTFNIATPDKNSVTLTPLLVHKTGQYIEFDPYTIPVEAKAQAQGSAITYGRRYLTQAIVGVPSEDDDGNDATESAPKGPVKTEAHREERPAIIEPPTDERLNMTQPQILKMFAEFSRPNDEQGRPVEGWVFNEDDMAFIRGQINECRSKKDLLALYDKTKGIMKARKLAQLNDQPSAQSDTPEAKAAEEVAGDLFDQPQGEPHE